MESVHIVVLGKLGQPADLMQGRHHHQHFQSQRRTIFVMNARNCFC